MKQAKPIIHGGDHVPGGPDPIPGSGGGSGIQFDTYPQTGGTLDTETSGNTSLTTVGDGADFLITTDAPTTHGKIGLHTQQGGDIQLHCEQGILQLLDDSEDGISVETTDGTAAIVLESAAQIVALTGTTFDLTTVGAYNHLASDDVNVVLLTTGKALIILDSLGNPIFRVNEDGSLQGKTGASLVFNL